MSKNGLARDTTQDATSGEVRPLKGENADLRRALSEQVLDVVRLKKKPGPSQLKERHSRMSSQGKLETFRPFESSDLSVRESLHRIGVSTSIHDCPVKSRTMTIG